MDLTNPETPHDRVLVVGEKKFYVYADVIHTIMSTTEGSKDNDDWVNNYTPLDLTNPATPHNRVLVVGETKFYVNAEHLSLYSEFFRTMFNSDFKEKNEEEIEIKEVEAEVFHAFLKLLHPHAINPVTKANYQQLVAYSRRFLAREAFTICEDFIVTNIKDLDLVDLLKMAFEYNWTSLKENLKKMIVTRSLLCPTCKARLYPYCYECEVTKPGYILQKECSAVVTKHRIAQLPTEIQAFILQIMLDRAST